MNQQMFLLSLKYLPYNVYVYLVGKTFIVIGHICNPTKQLKVRYKYTKFDSRLFIRMLAEYILLTYAVHKDY